MPSYSADSRERDEITRLLIRARTSGERDLVCGKRQWNRYQIGMRMEIETDRDGSDEPARSSVVLHSLSGGGFSFWSQNKIPMGAQLRVREWAEHHRNRWMTACVVHCSLGVNGHLIGAAFENPLPSDTRDESDGEQTPTAEASNAEAAPVRRTSRSRTPHSLVRRCATVSACATGVGVTATAACWFSISGSPEELWVGTLLGLVMAVACCLVGLMGLTRREAMFCQAFHTELKRLASGELERSNVPEAPSNELAGMRQALLELRARWGKREDDRRIQRKKLEEINLVKNNILSMVSHDMRTPLASILLYAQLLAEELDTLNRDDQKRFVGIISEECTRLSRLVDDLLEAQRLQAGNVRLRMEPVDLSACIRNAAAVFDVMARSKSMEFSVDCPDTLPNISADEDKIAQVISNLLSNAMKYTPDGGKIHMSATADNKNVYICVSDNGPGVPRDQWDQIFDRFAQLSVTKHIRELPGVGLGLYIVRQIVERHNGRVWIDSEVGRGSDFYVSLPIDAPQPVGDPEPQDVHCAGRVLVCDADPELVNRMSQALQHAQFDVRQAHSGCRLLALVDEIEFDVVVTDVLLPDMDAMDLLTALKAKSDSSFKLVVHSYAGEGERLRQMGVDVYLQRPATTDELIQAVHVARQARSATALTILLVGPRSSESDAFRRAATEAGHLSIEVPSVDEAARRVAEFPISLVLIHEDALGRDWAELEPLRDLLAPPVLVLSANPQRRERRTAEAFRVGLVDRDGASASELLVRVVDAVEALRMESHE